MRDCLVSKRWIEIFQEAINSEVFGCELKMTIASTALDLFRRRFLKHPIYKEPMECRRFIMNGYYGGRVEAFKRGKLIDYRAQHSKKQYYWYDYNSAYPAQMLKEYPLPTSAQMTINGNIDTIIKYHGTSDVEIECPYMLYPLLPVRRENKLIFPTGKFRGTYNHIELRRALELGYNITKIYKTLYYTRTFYPFKEYVTYLYNLRMKYKREKNAIYTEICKIFLNSLYGKLATKDMQAIEFFDFDMMTEAEMSKDDKEGRFNDMQVTYAENGFIRKGFKETNKECDQNYILPILSSCVTSYQRVQLHKDLVRLKGIYCDTDSILTDMKIEDSSELGELKLEKLVKKGWIIRPKCYMIYDSTQIMFQTEAEMIAYRKDNPDSVKIDKLTIEKGWNVKVKGINKMTSQRFYDILVGGKIPQMKFMKIKEAMKRHYTPNQRKKYAKEQDLEDDKREWSAPFDKDALQDSKPINLINDD